jgi:hypothetical protein
MIHNLIPNIPLFNYMSKVSMFLIDCYSYITAFYGIYKGSKCLPFKGHVFLLFLNLWPPFPILIFRYEIFITLVGKPEGKRPLWRTRCRWEDNIRMDLQRKLVVSVRVSRCNLLQWTVQLPTHHNNHAYLRLYSAVCAPDDGCK